jgi:hypothetical protein
VRISVVAVGAVFFDLVMPKQAILCSLPSLTSVCLVGGGGGDFTIGPHTVAAWLTMGFQPWCKSSGLVSVPQFSQTCFCLSVGLIDYFIYFFHIRPLSTISSEWLTPLDSWSLLLKMVDSINPVISLCTITHSHSLFGVDGQFCHMPHLPSINKLLTAFAVLL